MVVVSLNDTLAAESDIPVLSPTGLLWIQAHDDHCH
jgi:hypothetical protein